MVLDAEKVDSSAEEEYFDAEVGLPDIGARQVEVQHTRVNTQIVPPIRFRGLRSQTRL